MVSWPVRFFFQQARRWAYLRLLFPLVLALCLLFATVLVVSGLYSGIQGELRELEQRSPYRRQIVLKYAELVRFVSRSTLKDSPCQAMLSLPKNSSMKQNFACFPWEKLKTDSFSFVKKDAAEKWIAAQSSPSPKEQYRAHRLSEDERSYLQGDWRVAETTRAPSLPKGSDCLSGDKTAKVAETTRAPSLPKGRTMGKEEWRIFLRDLEEHTLFLSRNNSAIKLPVTLRVPPRMDEKKEPFLQIVVTKSFLQQLGYEEEEAPSWLFLYKESKNQENIQGAYRIPVWIRAILPYETLPGDERLLYVIPERLSMVLKSWDEISHHEAYATDALTQDCACFGLWLDYRQLCQPPKNDMDFYCKSRLQKKLIQQHCTQVPNNKKIDNLRQACKPEFKRSIDVETNKPFLETLIIKPKSKNAELFNTERKSIHVTLYFRDGVKDEWKRFQDADLWVYAGVQNQSRLRETSKRLGGFAVGVSISLIILGFFVTIAAMLQMFSLRIRQFGHLKAMGARTSNFLVIIFLESFFLFSFSALFGSAFGLPLGYSLSSQITERLRTQSAADVKIAQKPKEKRNKKKEEENRSTNQTINQSSKAPFSSIPLNQQNAFDRSLFDISVWFIWLFVYFILLALSLIMPTLYKQELSPNTLLKG